MQKRGALVVLILTLLSLAASGQACVTPVDGQLFKQDTVLCAAQYDLPHGITLDADTVVDCAGAALQGAGTGNGVDVIGDGSQIRNCIIIGYGIGLRVENVQGFLEDNLTFSGNGQDRSIAAGEQITLPTRNVTKPPVVPVKTTPPVTTPVPPVTQPVVTPPAGRQNTSIWLVADVKSEKLLENALSYEYNATVPQDVLAQRIAQLQETLGDVTITREFVYRDGKTTVRLTVSPDSGFFRRVEFDNITLYEYIPKCFAQLVDEVVFEGGNPVVLERDPLLKKVIPKGQPLEFSYSTMHAISPECQALFKVVGISAGVKVQTLSGVLADQGILEVIRIFPTESASVLVFILLVAGVGIWYKKNVHELK